MNAIADGPRAPRRAPTFTDIVRLRWSSLGIWFELIRNLAVRDIEIRYKHSLLGLYWALINPLLTAAIYEMVFGVILKTKTGTIPYPVFLLTGLTIWNLFGNGVTSAVGSVTGSASLLAKVYFPRIVLPTAAVLARLIDFLFSLVILAVFILVYRVPIHWTLLWAVVILGAEFMFALGIGYLCAALNVLYRDVSQLVGLVLMMWMWLSPVMYAASSLPTVVQSILLVNPLGALIQVQRDLIFQGASPNIPYVWPALAWSVFVFVAGVIVFKRIEPMFAEVM